MDMAIGQYDLFDCGTVDECQNAIDAGCNIDEIRGYGTRLMYACKNNEYEIVKYLINNGADPNLFTWGTLSRRYSPVEVAASEGYKDIIQLFYEKGGISWVTNALNLAAGSGHMDIIDYLINIGVNINEINEANNMTPLMIASFHGKTDAVLRLLDANASVNIKNSFGKGAIHKTVFEFNFHIIELLYIYGCDINSQDNDGQTPLMLCAFSANKCIENMKKLISLGCNLDVIDNAGNTALINACKKQQHLGIKLLLESGADKTLKNKDGKLAIDYLPSLELRILCGFDCETNEIRNEYPIISNCQF